MGLFKTIRIYYDCHSYVDKAAQSVIDTFQQEGYNVKGIKLSTGEWDISINKGNWVEVASGLSAALKFKITPSNPHVCAEASVGIFGQQIIPTIIAYTIFWPIVLVQVWGLIKQSSLDDKALNLLTHSFEKLSSKNIIVKNLN